MTASISATAARGRHSSSSLQHSRSHPRPAGTCSGRDVTLHTVTSSGQPDVTSVPRRGHVTASNSSSHRSTALPEPNLQQRSQDDIPRPSSETFDGPCLRQSDGEQDRFTGSCQEQQPAVVVVGKPVEIVARTRLANNHRPIDTRITCVLSISAELTSDKTRQAVNWFYFNVLSLYQDSSIAACCNE